MPSPSDTLLNLSDRIAEQMRQKSCMGNSWPGQRLSEAALSEHFIWRNTLREVFRLLTKEGLLRHEPNLACRSPPSIASIIDTSPVR